MKLSKQEGIKIQFHANVGGVQIKQSDWANSDPNDIAYIKNKPDFELKADSVGKKTPEGGEIFNQAKKAKYLGHAEGLDTESIGAMAHTEGQGTKALEQAGHSEGYYTISKNFGEHAQGRYNKSNSGTRDSVGIGDSEENRKNATETMEDGKHYIYGVGEYDGTNSVDPNANGVKATDVASVVKHDHEVRDFMRYGMSTINPQVTLPKWFMDSLVCWYDPARQGLKNGVDIKAGEPFLLKDFSKNGLDMTMHGFAGEGMSGMGGYNENFMNWVPSSSSEVEVVNQTKVKFSSSSNIDVSLLAFVLEPQNTIDFKIRISGITKNKHLYLFYNNARKKELLNGENQIKVTNNESEAIYPCFVTDFVGDCDIDIEILPLYDGALVFDGSDDFGVSKGQPILTDYTVFAKRKRLSNTHDYAAIASKSVGAGTASAFIFERKTNTWSFGKSTFVPPAKEDVVYQTKTSYNGTPIEVGSLEDKDVLSLGALGTDKGQQYLANFALYNFLLFNRTLSPEEIEWVKNNIYGNGVVVKNNAIETTQDGKTYIKGVGGYDGTNASDSKDVATFLKDGGACRALYESAGAVWNPQTGYYELNGLTDITEAQMANIISAGRVSGNNFAQAYASLKIRTNLAQQNAWYNSSYSELNLHAAFLGCEAIENICLDGSQTAEVYVSGDMKHAFYECTKLRKVVAKNGKLVPLYVGAVSSFNSAFYSCGELTDILLDDVRHDISFKSSPKITIDESNTSTLGFLLSHVLGGYPFTLTLAKSLEGKVPQKWISMAQTKQITIAFA